MECISCPPPPWVESAPAGLTPPNMGHKRILAFTTIFCYDKVKIDLLIRNFAERDDLLHPIPLYLAFSLRFSDRRFKSSNFGSPNKLLRSYSDMYSYEDVDD